VKAAAAKQQ
jgi:hypothetical protein